VRVALGGVARQAHLAKQFVDQQPLLLTGSDVLDATSARG
jgi:hypothetical protein